MVKALNFFKRKPGLSVDDFRHYWLNEHAAIIRAIPELRKYVASITLPSAYRNHEPLYDGISEAWFDDEAVIRATTDSAPRRAATADDAKFVDMSKAGSIIVDEVTQKEGTPGDGAVKMFSMLTRKPGTDVAAFQAYWRTHHGPLAAKIPQARRYIQCHVRPSGYSPGASPRYDGVAELWFDNFDAVRDSGITEEYRAVRLDEPKFLALPFPFLIASEHQIA
ncbi:EthD domain-containing protein [Candidatus Binatus sp.]|uniref:EthD domain-containing protein n=1 Tax=Candidatus Binatus sp. TaxID=2811406 RepID=UPI003CC6348B